MDGRIMRVYCFSATLLQLLRNNQGREEFLPLLEQIEKELHEYCVQFERWIEGEDAATICRRIYTRVDKILEQPKEVSCRAGCAACCRQYVAVTRAEAKHLIQLAHAKSIPLDRSRLQAQAQTHEDAWRHLTPFNAVCSFLDTETNQCRVYEDRPMSCRKYYVVTDSTLCDLKKNPGEQVGIWFDLTAEIIATAWMTVNGGDNMAKMILEELDET